jgi:hypothetical protein
VITQRHEIQYRHRGLTWVFDVWQDDSSWYWRVGRMDGDAPTQAEAEEAARQWIRGEGIKRRGAE